MELSTLQEVFCRTQLALTLRPLIDAFPGQNELTNPDPAARRGAATKMGNAGDAAALPALEGALATEQTGGFATPSRKRGLIRLRTGSNQSAHRAERLGSFAV